MLTLDTALHIPAHVLSTTVDQDAVLLNTQTNQYYALDEVGARFWGLLTEKNLLKDVYKMLLDEYEVEPTQLEQDLLELLADLLENNLVEIIA